ncbi:hypothetical protein CSC70_10125 [Pseudoxanthomonas kalamensis DSM 18571]|uniref:4'-phosphopantetheinyl transferase family protein n=1 Tax=Pseudoxanthomonas kalamensis TaxID=289483 RepID=UPI0013919B6F|nr:4'-phosphopantetheinyl transferase superfamily protein [Pseudoxanthomonas kalamensis]KAF1710019.1 hypothetical protein CSC70_10125 [Pseudoxanthomonas kalamensis DSM 18571]
MSLQRRFDLALGDVDAVAAVHDGVLLTYADLADWQSVLEQAWAWLDDSEAERIRRKRIASDAGTTLLAYALLRWSAGRVLGMRPEEVPVWRDENRCPRVGSGEVHVSLSHADGRALACVSTMGPVGGDIEPLSRCAAIADIGERVCHPDEWKTMTGLDAAVRNRALLELWVRKEALLKAAGIGLAREMDSFPAPAGMPLSLMPDAAGCACIEMLDLGEGWLGAVAAPVAATVRMVPMLPG